MTVALSMIQAKKGPVIIKAAGSVITIDSTDILAWEAGTEWEAGTLWGSGIGYLTTIKAIGGIILAIAIDGTTTIKAIGGKVIYG